MNIPCYSLPLFFWPCTISWNFHQRRDGNRIIHIMDSSVSSTFILHLSTPQPMQILGVKVTDGSAVLHYCHYYIYLHSSLQHEQCQGRTMDGKPPKSTLASPPQPSTRQIQSLFISIWNLHIVITLLNTMFFFQDTRARVNYL